MHHKEYDLKVGEKDTSNGSLELFQAHGTGYYTCVSTSFPKNKKEGGGGWEESALSLLKRKHWQIL